MTFEINTRKANDILLAYLNGKSKSVPTPSIFVNAYGRIIYTENYVNYKGIGQVINNERFKIGNVQYSFTQ